MIKISVMYPHANDAVFDHDYYRAVHMPLVKERLGKRISHYQIDKGISSGEAGTPPTYVCMCHLYSESVEVFQAGIARHGQELDQDIKNFTILSPIYQISDVVM